MSRAIIVPRLDTPPVVLMGAEARWHERRGESRRADKHGARALLALVVQHHTYSDAKSCLVLRFGGLHMP